MNPPPPPRAKRRRTRTASAPAPGMLPTPRRTRTAPKRRAPLSSTDERLVSSPTYRQADEDLALLQRP
ncbi:cytochrome D ubiquinol oxidase subunit II, partial [Burkholderia pseudomallei]